MLNLLGCWCGPVAGPWLSLHAATITSGASGYCECTDNRRAAESGCGHDEFVCSVECAELLEFPLSLDNGRTDRVVFGPRGALPVLLPIPQRLCTSVTIDCGGCGQVEDPGEVVRRNFARLGLAGAPVAPGSANFEVRPALSITGTSFCLLLQAAVPKPSLGPPMQKVAGKVVALQREQSVAAGNGAEDCVAFRQTAQCDPRGPREAAHDKACTT